MSTIFEIPSTLCGKKFTQHEVFSVFWLSFEIPRNKSFSTRQQNFAVLAIFASHLCVKNSPKRNLNNGHLEISGPTSQHQHWHCIFFVSFPSRFFFVERIEHLCSLLWLVSQDHYQLAKIVPSYDFVFPTILKHQLVIQKKGCLNFRNRTSVFRKKR